MNLAKLFETQRVLDARIEKEHPILEGEDRLAKKILALQVELGECANEWRGFKFWSTNQKPNISKPVTTFYGSRNGETTNPLLEEYVDCLHFILSIGLEMELTNTDISERKQLTHTNVTQVFSDLMLAAGTLLFTDWDKSHNFGTVLHGFIYLGELLGFTWEKIEQAYYDKNAINHKRQSTGY